MSKSSLYSIVAIGLLFGAGIAYKNYTPPKPIEEIKPATPITPLAAPTPQVLSKDEAINLIKADKIKSMIQYLAHEKLEGRMSGKKGNVVAFDSVKKAVEAMGLKTEYQKFSIQRMNPGPKNEQGDDFTKNLYAWIEGSDPTLKDEIVVIGGHLDHIGYGRSMAMDNVIGVHPGADDNASGSALTLAVAEVFTKILAPPRTIVFQWYSAEEMNLIGSRYYCDHPTFPRDKPDIKKHIFMLNSDMVSRLDRGVYDVAWNTGDSSPDVGVIINQLSSKYKFAKNITSRGAGGSDHAPFYNKGIPIVFLHTGLHEDYHKVSDTADKANCEGVEIIAKYAFEIIYEVAHNKSSPKFNYADFKPMEHTHDHGHKGAEFPHTHNHE